MHDGTRGRSTGHADESARALHIVIERLFTEFLYPGLLRTAAARSSARMKRDILVVFHIGRHPSINRFTRM